MRLAAVPDPVLLVLVSAFGGVGVAGAAAAEDSRFEPARFVGGPDSLQHVVRFPSAGRDGIVDVRCEGILSETGRIRGASYCQAVGEGLYAYELAASDIAFNLRLQPARVDGVARRVWFQYRLEFEKRGDDRRVRVYPNHGQQIETFGDNYIGPQRILNTAKEQALFRICGPRMKFIAHASVSETGRAVGVSVANQGEGNAACRRGAQDLVQSSDFLPAMVNDAVVRALYSEPFFGPSSVRRR